MDEELVSISCQSSLYTLQCSHRKKVPSWYLGELQKPSAKINQIGFMKLKRKVNHVVVTSLDSKSINAYLFVGVTK